MLISDFHFLFFSWNNFGAFFKNKLLCMSLHWKCFWSASDQKNHPKKTIIIRELFLATFARWQFFPKVPKKNQRKVFFWVFPMDKFQIFLKILQNFVRLYIN